eukprot:TRINITY_DN4042_c0_g1_i10.p1 TRINITY_DN4042_c0_g1~~TRINITY_DN4042_c0_g1_i10.p1  ORF type:complete len:323 (+),score=73.15 TRINITY_DN4042_c0_g1_i10:47-1015(+)
MEMKQWYQRRVLFFFFFFFFLLVDCMEEDLAFLAEKFSQFRIEMEREKAHRIALQKEVDQLKQVIVEERQKRQQLTNWIKDNIGTDLEHVTERVSSALKCPPRPTNTSTRSFLDTPPLPRVTENDDLHKSSNEILPEAISTNHLSKSSYEILPEAISTNQIDLPTSPKERIVIAPTNVILERIEDHVYSKKVFFSSLPSDDAIHKANRPGRLKHFLTKRDHARTKYLCPSLPDKAVTFANQFGAKLIFAPDGEDVMEDEFILGLYDTDRCYPVCPDGLYRSQIMYLVLKATKRYLGCSDTASRVVLPHGTLSGYDPFSGNKT